MKRTSTEICIESPSGNPDKPCYTWLPWLNDAPDFTGFTGQTLFVLQNAWEEGKNSIEAIADLIPNQQSLVIREVDARRLRLALLELRCLDNVEMAVSTLGRAAQIEWEFATVIREDYPLVSQLSSALGLDINQIFEKAATYT